MRELFYTLGLFIVIVIGNVVIVAQTDMKPPVAKKETKITKINGYELKDDYFWLRDKKNPEVIKYLEAENAYTEAAMKPHQAFADNLYKEMLGRIKQTDLSVPYKFGEYWYYTKTEEGKQYPMFFRSKKQNGDDEKLLLDQNELAKGFKYYAIGSFDVSDDGNLLAFSSDNTGYRQYTLQIKDLRTGKILSDKIERVTSVEWANDNKTLFLVTEDNVTKRSDKFWKHTVGSNDNQLVYEEKDELYDIGVERSRDKKMLFLGAHAKTMREYRYLPADQPNGVWKIVLPREKDHEYAVDFYNGEFYFTTNKNAENFRVARAPLSDPSEKNWKDFIAHNPAIKIEGVDFFKDYAIVTEHENGLEYLKIMDLKTKRATARIATPESVYTTSLGTNPEFDTPVIRYNYASMITPNSTYEYDFKTRESKLLKQMEIPSGYDKTKYETARVWAMSRDGVKVPISLVMKKGTQLDGKSPMLLYAYGSYGASMTPNPDRFTNQPIKQDIGVTLKYTITPNITLDAAYNPDFAEIEADAPVITANQRFPIFFQEKRPFFLEGAEIFQSPLQVFYSRTIIDPDLAVKLTGKIGKTSFGFLAASDKAPGNYDEDERNDVSLRPRISEFLDRNALFGVVRIKPDFGRENNVGFFGTYRSFPEQRNVSGGFDGRFKLNPQTVMSFQAVGTTSRRCFFNFDFDPTLDPTQAQRNRDICGSGSTNQTNSNRSTFNNYRTGNGFGYVWNLDYTEKNRGWFIQADGRSRYYRTDAGFTRRTNTNSILLAGRLSTEPKPKAKIIRFEFRPYAQLRYDWQGRAQDESIGANFGFALQRNTRVGFETGYSYERIFEEEFGLRRSSTRRGAFFGESERSTRQQYFSGNINSSPTKKISFGVFMGLINNAYDFDFGGGSRFPRVSSAILGYQTALDEYLRRLAENPNDPTNIAPLFPGQDPGAGRQFDVQVGVEYKPTDPLRMSLEYRKSRLSRFDTGQTAYDSNIGTFRSTYQFTRFTFARLRLDYNSLASNVSGQFLVGWNPSPGTAFYVGYNDNFNYNGFNPYTGQFEPRFERNNRTFFIRASYLLRKSF